jgi:hypothetical protein
MPGKGGSAPLDFLEWYYVAERLSEVCNWQGKVSRVDVIGNEVVVQFDLGIQDGANGDWIWRSDVWGEKIGKVGFGGSVAIAKQHAFKRAAATFGLGIELYQKEKPSFSGNYSPKQSTSKPAAQGINFGEQVKTIKKLLEQKGLSGTVDFSILNTESAAQKIKELGG